MPKFKTFVDDQGVIRFVGNRIVCDLLEAACGRATPLDLNTIWIRHHNGSYSRSEMRELYRLIRYSVSGYGDFFGGSG